MKYGHVFILFLLPALLFGQECREIYKDKLEPNSKLISCEMNYTIEELSDGQRIIKRYWPENKVIIQRITYNSDTMNKQNGLFEERWDDGTLVRTGNFVNNMREGKWLLNRNESGVYRDNRKEGVWTKINSDSTLLERLNFVAHQLHGEQIYYDTLGQKRYVEFYENGTLISTTADSSQIEIMEFPVFPGCEDSGLTGGELQTCAGNKLLRYVYSKIRYPERAIANNIEGLALVQFYVDVNGQVTDVRVLNGVSKEIKQEVLRIIHGMPTWYPGTINSKPAKIKYTLPIKFKLQ